MSDIAYTNDPDQDAQTSLLHSFAIASVIVVAGVAASAMLLSKPETEVVIGLPSVPTPTWLEKSSLATSSESWLDLAEQAFTSGRITEPVQENALFYYQQAVAANSLDERASQGLQKVVSYVLGNAENAIYDGDWQRARRSAEELLVTLGTNEEAQALLDRVQKFEGIESYARIAVNQIATDRLLSPLGDNALHSYEQILLLDPNNAEAKDGIRVIAQRLLAKSQSAVVDGDYQKSLSLIAQARRVDPDLAGLDEAAKLTQEFAKLTQEKALELRQKKAAEISQSTAAAVEKQIPQPQPTELPKAPVERVVLVSDLQILRDAKPIFPPRAEAVEKEGWVEVNFRVDEKGEVVEPEVVRSSDRVFERPALVALRKWRFAPYIDSGVAVTVRSGVRFSFKN